MLMMLPAPLKGRRSAHAFIPEKDTSLVDGDQAIPSVLIEVEHTTPIRDTCVVHMNVQVSVVNAHALHDLVPQAFGRNVEDGIGYPPHIRPEILTSALQELLVDVAEDDRTGPFDECSISHCSAETATGAGDEYCLPVEKPAHLSCRRQLFGLPTVTDALSSFLWSHVANGCGAATWTGSMLLRDLVADVPRDEGISDAEPRT